MVNNITYYDFLEVVHFKKRRLLRMQIFVHRGVRVSFFAIGRKVRGLKPGQRRWIFKGDRNL
jgi:hypothetical protein